MFLAVYSMSPYIQKCRIDYLRHDVVSYHAFHEDS